MTMTNGEFALQLSETIKHRLFSLPGASRAITELSEAATVASFLVMLTDDMMHSTDETEIPHMAGCIRQIGARLAELTAALPFETPRDLQDVMAEAQQALVRHGFAPGPAANRPRS